MDRPFQSYTSFKKTGGERKPNPVYTAIYLGRTLPYASLRPTRNLGRAVLERLPTWSCTGWGLHCHPPRGGRGELLPRHFTLTTRFRAWRYVFCCTFRRLAAPGRYPASCPAVFGLSSPPAFRRASAAACSPPAIFSIVFPDCTSSVSFSRAK